MVASFFKDSIESGQTLFNLVLLVFEQTLVFIYVIAVFTQLTLPFLIVDVAFIHTDIQWQALIADQLEASFTFGTSAPLSDLITSPRSVHTLIVYQIET